MEDFIRNIFKGRGGFSIVEVLTAIALSGLITLGVMRLTDESQDQALIVKQNFEQDNYMRAFRKFLMNKTTCDTAVTSSGSGIQVRANAFDYDFDTGITIKRTRVLLPQLTAGKVEVVPVTILVDFNRNISGLENTHSVKKTTAAIEFNDRVFVGCSNYDAESEKAAYKLTCEMLGGTFVDGISGSESCSFDVVDPNSDILDKAKRKICTTVYGGTYINGKCTSLNMPLTAVGQNIKTNSYVLSGNSVSTFNQLCSGSNNFVGGANSNGSANCKTVKFCTKCDANCPASGGVCRGANPTVITPPVDPYTGGPLANSVCSTDDRVPGYPICGKGTKDCSGSVNNPVNQTSTNCWNENYSDTDMTKINPLGYPTTRWDCGGSTRPASISNLSGPCNIGDICNFDFKYGTKVFTCEEDTGQCPGSVSLPRDPAPDPEPEPEPEVGKADCTYISPYGWTQMHSGILHYCVEYYTTSGGTNKTLKHGETKVFRDARYCLRGGVPGNAIPRRTESSVSCNDGVKTWRPEAEQRCFCKKGIID